MRISPQEIKSQPFPARMSGYDKNAVRSFLNELSLQQEQMIAEVKKYQERLHNIEMELSEKRNSEDQISRAIVSAERMAQSMREETQREVDHMLMEAKFKVRELEQQLADLEKQYEERNKDLEDRYNKRISELEKSYRSRSEELHSKHEYDVMEREQSCLDKLTKIEARYNEVKRQYDERMIQTEQEYNERVEELEAAFQEKHDDLQKEYIDKLEYQETLYAERVNTTERQYEEHYDVLSGQLNALHADYARILDSFHQVLEDFQNMSDRHQLPEPAYLPRMTGDSDETTPSIQISLDDDLE